MFDFCYRMTEKDLIEYLKSVVSHMSLFSDEAYSYITVRGLFRVFKGKISENGEMAPMAYTYLMKLTYYWFLADTDEERERCRSFAECFRKNGYKTTGGCFPKVDEGIEFMPAKVVPWSLWGTVDEDDIGI